MWSCRPHKYSNNKNLVPLPGQDCLISTDQSHETLPLIHFYDSNQLSIFEDSALQTYYNLQVDWSYMQFIILLNKVQQTLYTGMEKKNYCCPGFAILNWIEVFSRPWITVFHHLLQDGNYMALHKPQDQSQVDKIQPRRSQSAWTLSYLPPHKVLPTSFIPIHGLSPSPPPQTQPPKPPD